MPPENESDVKAPKVDLGGDLPSESSTDNDRKNKESKEDEKKKDDKKKEPEGLLGLLVWFVKKAVKWFKDNDVEAVIKDAVQKAGGATGGNGEQGDKGQESQISRGTEASAAQGQRRQGAAGQGQSPQMQQGQTFQSQQSTSPFGGFNEEEMNEGAKNLEAAAAEMLGDFDKMLNTGGADPQEQEDLSQTQDPQENDAENAQEADMLSEGRENNAKVAEAGGGGVGTADVITEDGQVRVDVGDEKQDVEKESLPQDPQEENSGSNLKVLGKYTAAVVAKEGSSNSQGGERE